MSKRYLSGFDIVCDQAIFNDNNLLYNLPNENKSPEFSKKIIYLVKEGKNEWKFEIVLVFDTFTFFFFPY